MCNKYAQKAPASAFEEVSDQLDLPFRIDASAGNLEPREAIYPDQDAPVLTCEDGALTLTMMRWGFPPAGQGKGPITNIRNLASPWWRNVNGEFLTGCAYRCLVPFSAFAEPVRDSTWFRVPGREAGYFAGIWRPWQGERLAEVPGKTRRARTQGDWRLFAFLTTEANDIVRPVHEKAMPVILTDPREWRQWLGGGEASLALQRPLENRLLEVVS